MQHEVITVSGMLARMNPPELFLRADAVVEAVVEETTGQPISANVRDDEALPMILTPHVLRIDVAYKTPRGLVVPRRVVVFLLGGTLGTTTVHVNSEAVMTPGERVILFLARDLVRAALSSEPHVFNVLGGFQGKFTIVDGGVEPMVTRIDDWRRMSYAQFRRRFLDGEESGPMSSAATA
jgi:hypothetical protein